MHHNYLEAIKSFEGFTPKAEWDYAQFSNGYGTKAQHAGETITPDEAERRFKAEIAAARAIVDKHADGWDEGTKAALTSLTFNAGTRWISSGLGDAVRSQDVEAVKERFLQYTKAGGESLPGLVRRRLAEFNWIGSEGAPAATPVKSAASSPAVSPAASTIPAASPSMVQAVAAAPTAPAAEASLAPAGRALAFLGEREAQAPSGASSDAQAAQSLSMLVELMFDLQMRAAQPDGTSSDEKQTGAQGRTA